MKLQLLSPVVFLLCSYGVLMQNSTHAASNNGCCTENVLRHKNCNTGKSYIRLNEFFRPASPERNSHMHLKNRDEDSRGFHAQAVVFGSQTTQECDFARLFTPGGKNNLVAAENYATSYNNKTNDLYAGYFGVQSAVLTPLTARPIAPQTPASTTGEINLTFESTLKLKAAQKAFGIGFELCKELCTDWWAGLAFPILRLENKLCVQETINNPGGAPLGSTATAGATTVPAGRFNSVAAGMSADRIKYGKIGGRRCHEKWGVADVELMIGHTFLNDNCCSLNSYVGVVIPTGHKPCAEYLFAPQIGNGKHFGLFTGTKAWVKLFSHHNFEFSVATHASSRYLFSNRQLRTLDLVDKPWSRYMWAYDAPLVGPLTGALPPIQALRGFTTADQLQTAINNLQPVGNFTTVCVKARPGYSLDLTTSFMVDHNCFHAEVGMNVYARAAERLHLDKPWVEGPGVASLGDFLYDTIPTTQPTTDFTPAGYYPTASQSSTIERISVGDVFVADNEFESTGTESIYLPIRERDLDLNSAASAATVTNSIYASVGYEVSDTYLVDVGASYDFGKHTFYADRWTVWGKIGASF